MTAYDELPYPSYCHPQLHPDRLGVPALVAGMDPAPASACRVLELGCGDGMTLLALAQALPGSSFVGVDLAATAVARGQATIAAVGLPNATLLAGDVAALGDELGTFDYVVCHGVFSWVPAPARTAILAAIRRHLDPGGVAYLSYNANPGGQIREMVRQMLRWHLRGKEATPADLLQESASLVRFLASARPEDDLWRRILEGELAAIQRHEPIAFLHDDLAVVNRPFWLHEVVEMAGQHGLRLLGEADDLRGGDVFWPKDARELLQATADRVEVHDGYVDLLTARRFHRTLLCHADVILDAPAPPNRLRRLRVAGELARPDALDLAAGVEASFEAPGGHAVASDTPLMKAALDLVARAWPRSMPFDELLAGARAAVGAAGGDDAAALGRFLLAAHGAHAVRFRREEPTWPMVLEEVGQRPLGAPLARHQLATGSHVVPTLLADAAVLEPADVELLAACDGTRDLEALRDAVGTSSDVAAAVDGLARRALLLA